MLDGTNPQIAQDVANGTLSPEAAAISYNYTWPLVMLACLGVAALILGLVLKVIDRKKHLGLELPNVKAATEPEVLESEAFTTED